MMENILYIILAILGLSFLVFIHELGHYFMAKRAKMKIETFSIGFGKPILSWYRKNIKWQIGILPFGGFVKIAGMQKEDGKDPYEIKDGYFGRKPLDRIKVSVMGPLVNFVFAFLVFVVIWSVGGRNKPFHEYTKKIGYVDKKSELFDLKVKPGDEIIQYNNKPYTGFTDVLHASITNGKEVEIKGYKVNYFQNQRYPFDYTIKTYTDVEKGKDFSTIGIQMPARYLILENIALGSLSPVMKDSEIKAKDRLLWANGEILFSNMQLSDILNSNRAFLTILRDDKIIHANINLVKISHLKNPISFKNDLDDYRYFKKIKTNLNDLYSIPYSFDENAKVKKPLNFVDETKALQFSNTRDAYSVPLQKGDKIIAVGGERIKNGANLFIELQNPKILFITQRDSKIFTKVSYKDMNKNFDENLDIKSLNQIVKFLGTPNEITQADSLYLLKPIKPIAREEMANLDKAYGNEYFEIKRKIEAIKNPKQQQEALKVFDQMSKTKVIGVALSDQVVKYNPNPLKMFSDGFKNTYQTLISLITGVVSPKYLSGPIGIVQVVKISFKAYGPLEALYWLGFISLNLGFLNILPIPVLDGGHVVFSLFEIITKKRIKIKTMERLIIPFVVLLIGGILFVTVHDILRIVKNFF
ncbi:MAG: putative zinc metalloprotease [Candidatus Anoxychlamydiales bacterium]|nr:putative zinc metalloprotease [Candidatus Anoxychlamydiales bacterium]